MNLNELLKKYRLQAGLSQNEAAEAFDVSPHTIQNWEYCRIPANTQLALIMDVYQIPYDVFQESYFSTICPASDVSKDTPVHDLPDALFYDDSLKKTVQNLTFTEFETDLLKHLAIYCPDWMHSRNEEDIYRQLPYEYAHTIDIIDFKRIIESLKRDRFNHKEDIANSVTDFITGKMWTDRYNTEPVKKFDINELPTEYIIDMIFDIVGNIDWRDLRQIKEIKNNHTCLFEKDFDVRKYLKQTRPQEFDCTNLFKNHWWNLIWCSKNKYYDESHVPDKYAGAWISSFNRWMYDVLIDNKPEESNAPEWIHYTYTCDSNNIITSCTASLTKKGEELWEYALQHPEYFGLSDET